MEKKTHNQGPLLPGIILVSVGAAFLLAELNIIKSEMIWPMFILAPGLGFLIMYFYNENRRANAGLLIPGMITSLIGAFFFYLNATDWKNMEFLWPVFPMIVGVSFLAFYFGGGRQKKDQGILIPAGILLGVGILFVIFARFSYKFWPVILIVLGLIMLVNTRKREGKEEKEEVK